MTEILAGMGGGGKGIIACGPGSRAHEGVHYCFMGRVVGRGRAGDFGAFHNSHFSARGLDSAGAAAVPVVRAGVCGLGVGFSFGRRYFVPVILGAAVVGTWIAVGPLALGAALLFVFSATVLGKLVFGSELEGSVAFLGGSAIWILLLSCLIRVPIQYAAVYLILLALPVGAGFAGRSAVGVGMGAIVSGGVDSDGGGIRCGRFGGVRGRGALAGGAEAGG